ncbi:RNA-dependent RNA polymerase [Tulasnella partitivirus 2]|nr:RNA-dependent RNA polymerase [Tulasnella partitivirus 2]
MQNLRILGYQPRFLTPNASFAPSQQISFSPRQEEHHRKIVRRALRKYGSKELIDETIHGYRRSAGDDIAAEKDFLKTDQPYVDLKRDFHYKRALRLTEKLFRPSRQLRPISFPDLRFYPWNLSTSAEAPFTIKKRWYEHVRTKQAGGDVENSRMSFHNLYNEIFHENRRRIHMIKDLDRQFWEEDGTPKPYYWAELHTRAHLVKAEKEDKNRAVFGVPKLLLMAENMFIWPLMSEYLNMRVDAPLLWGFETIRGGWKKLRRDIRSKSRGANTFISADWSGFDHKALHAIIDDVHHMWRSWFTFDDGYQPTNVYPDSSTGGYSSDRIDNLWNWMTWNIKHIRIRGASDALYQWQFNGIASGYQQTQLLDSFVNCIMLLTVLSEAGIDIDSPEFYIRVQGDDSIICFRERKFHLEGKHFLAKISMMAKERFNADLSPDKTTYGDNLNDLEVLSYKNRNGIAYREEAELLAHLLYPERPRAYEALAAASVGIAMASMGCSRSVYLICRDIHMHLTSYHRFDQSKYDRHYIFKGMKIPIPNDLGFPSFDELFSQNFDLRERTEAEKQHLWPTRDNGVRTEQFPDGFYFLE